MGHSNGIITAPVNTDDVSAMLGIASHDVAFLCSDSMGGTKKINMWAKYKPEAVGSPATLSLASRKANNFGLSPTTVFTGFSTFRAAVNNGSFTGGWTYKRVSPYVYNADGTIKSGRGDWARLDDFVGYNGSARCPFGTLLPFTGILGTNSNQRTVIPLDAPDDVPSATDDGGLLMLTDFEQSGYVFRDWYLGLLLRYSDSKYLVGFSSQKMAGNSWQVDFGHLDPATYAGSDIKGVPFLASTNNVNDGTMKIVGIANSGVKIVLRTITQMVQSIISCSFVSAISMNATFVAQITNTDSTQKVLAGVAIMVATSSSGANQTTIKSFGSVTIPANSTWTQTGTITVTNRSYCYCKLISTTTTWGTIDSGWVMFEELEDNPEG